MTFFIILAERKLHKKKSEGGKRGAYRHKRSETLIKQHETWMNACESKIDK